MSCARISSASRHRGVSLRTVERAVAAATAGAAAEARATLRFETPPGRQLQIDFGETRVPIGGERVRVYLFVATLGYSRRPYVQAFRHERQSAWLDGIEAAFRHFGGVPEEVLLDNARALVTQHDAATREVTLQRPAQAFAGYWRFRPRACAPYRARTKGKDERGVGYVKRNAIAGHAFASWEALEAHLAWWMREIADVRVHGTTGEPPLERFERDEAAALRPIAGRPPFRQIRELVRKVQADCAVEIDTNTYSRALAADRRERAGQRRAPAVCASTTPAGGSPSTPRPAGRRERIIDRGHLAGIIGLVRRPVAAAPAEPPPPPPDLLRALASTRRSPGEAGDGGRSRGARRHADAAEADRDPRPARQPARRGRRGAI